MALSQTFTVSVKSNHFEEVVLIATSPVAPPRKKKERDKFLDFLKLLCCFLVVMAHTGSRFGVEQYQSTVTNELMAMTYNYYTWEAIGPFTNYVVLSFFTFTTGYWFCNEFKKIKGMGLMGKGIDTKLSIRYFAKNYSAYWPFILYGTLFSFITVHLTWPTLWTENPLNLVLDFLNGIPQFLGIFSTGINPGEYAVGDLAQETIAAWTNNFTDATKTILSYNSTLWYMSALIVYGGLWFTIFMKSESFGLFVWAPINYAAHNIWYSMADTQFMGPAVLGISSEYMRLCGPWCVGIWAWYVVDYLKKADLSKKQCKFLSGACVVGLVWWICSFFFMGHGVPYFDLPIALCLIPLLSGKVGWTKWFSNHVLDKVPGIKHINILSMGLFIHHTPILAALQDLRWQGKLVWLDNLTIEQIYGLVIALCLVATVPYFFVDKYVLQRINKGIAKLFRLNEPVYVPGTEPKPEPKPEPELAAAVPGK